MVELISIFHFHIRENRRSLPWKLVRRTKTGTWEEGMNCVKAFSPEFDLEKNYMLILNRHFLL